MIKPLIFVSDELKDVVDIYLQGKNHKMVGQITGLSRPSGLATDTDDNLYVASLDTNTDAPNILVYARPYTKGPKLELDANNYYSAAIAVSTSGVIAAANYCGPPSCNGTGNVSLYAKNSTQPCATIADVTNFASLFGVTFDDKGNLFIGGYGPSPNYTPAVGEIKGGCHAKKITLLSTTNALAFSAPIHLDKANRIAIYDGVYSSNTQVIDAYNPPKNGSLGSPVTTTMLVSTPGNDFAFLASGRDLYFNNQTSGGGYTCDEYDYAEGGAAKSTISVGGASSFVYGVALAPPLAP